MGNSWNGSDWDGSVQQFGTIQVSDYEASGDGDDTDWSSSNVTTNMFGACLRSVAGGALLDGTTWARDTVDGDCADGDADPWKPIVATPGTAGAKVATAPSLSTAAQVNIAFGLRTSTSQAPGRYVAPLAIEVVAPAV